MVLATSVLLPTLAAACHHNNEENVSKNYPRDLEVGDKVTVTDWCHITENKGKVVKITPTYIYVEVHSKVMKFRRFNQICGNFQIDDLFYDVHEKF